MLDGTKPCTLPNPGNEAEPFEITDAVNGGVSTLQSHTTRSINCAFGRLSQIVGLHRVVDTIYRMAESPYLYRDQPASERLPIEPFASLATGANEMAPIDMASGIQALANEGVHHDPYYVDYIDGPDGERIHTHLDPGVQVLDRDAALATVEILKGPIYGGGTGRRAAFDDRRPAFGKTGTQDENTNAWFVGGTKQLATAVWVGDPNAYTPMARTRTFPGIPEFIADGVPRVQGGFYPGSDLEGLHAAGAHVPASRRLGTSRTAQAPECSVVSAWQRMCDSRGRLDRPHRPPLIPKRLRRPCRRRTRMAPPAETVPPATVPVVRIGPGRYDDPARQPRSVGAAAVAAGDGYGRAVRTWHTDPR